MKICLLSDLHREFRNTDEEIFKYIPKEGYELLILAGDISDTPEFVEYICDNIEKEIIFVLGNHEYYSGYSDDHYYELMDKYDNLHVFASKLGFLDFGEYRFVCGTNWPYIENADRNMISRSINDFRFVSIDEKSESKLTFEEDLKRIIDISKDKTLIAVSHFLPDEKCISEQFKNSNLNVYFCSQIDYNSLSKFKYWFFGHTHDKIDVESHGCRMISNPLGYPGENRFKYNPVILNV